MIKNRKPNPQPVSVPNETPTPTRLSADATLNNFLKENKIALALGKFKVQFTDIGTMIIDKPNIIAVYEDELDKNGIKVV